MIIVATLAWLHVMNGFDGDDVRNNDYWDDTTSTVSRADSNTRYMAKIEGIAEQTSLYMKKSKVHMYAIYGGRLNTAKKNEGRSIVNIGYKKAH